jgi:hypothetical protein
MEAWSRKGFVIQGELTMQPRTTAGRRTRNTVVVALIVAALWTGAALARGAAPTDRTGPTGPVAHFSRAVDLIRG